MKIVMKPSLVFLFALMSWLLLLGCGGVEKNVPEENAAIVLAAASTVEAMNEIVDQFELQTGTQVVLCSGASNGLARQIAAGSPANVFVSANQQWADAIIESGIAEESTPLLTNRLVLVVPKGNPARVQQPSDLNSDEVRRIAIAGENVPAGIYAEQVLRKLGLYETLVSVNKLVRGSDVRLTLTYIERGEVEAGIVYATDAKNSDGVEIVSEFDPQSHDAIVYPVLLLNNGIANVMAKPFYEYLKSDEAIRVFESHGFRPAR
ncbi:Molybdate-binding periplasmic protein precursor [Planctomycetes bacterium CA13]|uniref:Molybdate-binding periplasmic protein n=1 Tax=Novipirellula herctigrandis TaxID=2527986 RepID=A0A5C5Z6W6_9BACT|nr:Molybdate-binding periplasmic protein precursor [Planctomycetes bacterium CA13]